MTFNAKGSSGGPGNDGGGGQTGKTLTCTPITEEDGLPLGQSLFDTLVPSSLGAGKVDEGQYLLKVLPIFRYYYRNNNWFTFNGICI